MARTWYTKKRASTKEVSETEACNPICLEQIIILNQEAYKNKTLKEEINKEGNEEAKEITNSSVECQKTGSKQGNQLNGNMLGKIFCVDYSKRGTARCKKCKKAITKGEIRIGKSVQFKDKYIYQYYHVHCLFLSFQKARTARNVISNIDDLDGADSILEAERREIEKLISDFNSNKKKPLPLEYERKSIKHKPLILEDPKQRRTRLRPTNIPSIKIMYTNADQMTKNIELIKRIEKEKPLIVAVCEVKLKNAMNATRFEYNIPNYTLHSVNLSGY